MRWAVAVLVASILGAGSVLSAGPPLAAQGGLVEQFNRISPSVGALYVQDMEGDIRFLCTVTAVRRQGKATVLATAYHCVERGQAYVVTFDGKRFWATHVWKIPRWEADESLKRKWGEPRVDMALFLVAEDIGAPLIPTGTDQGVRPGEGILTVGFPLGITKTRYSGIIAGRLDKAGSDFHGYLILQIFLAPGSSGSAVVSMATGKVIGVLVALAQSQIGLPVVFATPISYERYLAEVPR